MMHNTWSNKWIQALKSSKYKQTRGRLRSRDGLSFDALGVLCDVIDDSLWRHEFVHSDTGNLISEFSYNWCVHYPPTEILEFAGMSPTTMMELLTLTDKKNYSFSEVANWLSKNNNNRVK